MVSKKLTTALLALTFTTSGCSSLYNISKAVNTIYFRGSGVPDTISHRSGKIVPFHMRENIYWINVQTSDAPRELIFKDAEETIQRTLEKEDIMSHRKGLYWLRSDLGEHLPEEGHFSLTIRTKNEEVSQYFLSINDEVHPMPYAGTLY